MQGNGYWDRAVRARTSRRRLLAGGSGVLAGLGAIGLVGCGSSGNGSSSGKDSSGLVVKPVDTTGQAKAGGVLKDFQEVDVLHFDAAISNQTSVVNAASVWVYPRLLKYVAAKYPKDADGSSEGELAESFEVSGDKLQLTFKIRPGVKWDNRAPTSGREADAQDVVFTWNKFARLHPGAGDMSSVDSLSAPDSKTVVVKLKQPDSSIIPLFTAWDHLYIMPRESDGGFDPKTEVRGHGPYILEEHVPSARVVWRKNPDYYNKGKPYPDKVERPIVSDHAQLLAQFKAGTVWTSVVGSEDVVAAKRDVPDARLVQNDSYPYAAGPYISFGFEGNSPFKDARMRQAIGMVLDGEAYADTIENRDGFKREGLDLPVAYNAVVPAGWNNYWLNPQDEKAFGPNAKYLKYDPAEAKKLVAAAGFPNGVDVDYIYNQEMNYGAVYQKIVQVTAGMFPEGNIRVNLKPLPYRQFYDNYWLSYINKTDADAAAGKVGFNGMMLRTGRGSATVGAQLFQGSHKDGSAYHGLTPDGKNAYRGDPKINDMLEKIRLEYDIHRQEALVYDFTRYYTGQAYSVTRPVSAKGFSLWWPVIQNQGVYKTYPGGSVQAETNIYWWIDPSKPPLGKA
jgi:peptide/nickel transport system substrate-binding protein